MLIPLDKQGGAFHLAGGPVGCLLIHGFTGTPWAFRGMGEWLNRQGLTVSAPLLPGHGTRPGDMVGISWQEWLHYFESARERLEEDCREIFLIGHSMGGSLALLMAARRSCAGVVSLSAPMVNRDLRMHLIPFLKPFIRQWEKKSSRSGSAPEMAYPCYPLPAVTQFMSLVREARRQLPRVICPALILHARGDRRIRDYNAGIIMRKIASRKKRQLYLPSPCHTIMTGDDAGIVQEEIEQFIRIHTLPG